MATDKTPTALKHEINKTAVIAGMVKGAALMFMAWC